MEGGGDTKGMMYAERQSKMAILTAAAADAANSLMTSLLAHNVWWVTWFVCLDFLFHWVCVRVCVCVYTRFYIHILFAKSAICPCFYYMPAIATQLLPLLLPLLLTVGLVCSSSSPLSLPFLHLHAAARLSLTRIFCVPQTVVVAFVKFSSVFLSIFTVWLLKPLFLTLPPHATFLLWFLAASRGQAEVRQASFPPPVRPRCHSCHSNFVVVVGDGKHLGYTLCTQHFSNPWKNY